MKIFWALMAALLVATGVMLSMRGGGGGEAGGTLATAARSAPEPATEPMAAPAGGPVGTAAASDAEPTPETIAPSGGGEAAAEAPVQTAEMPVLESGEQIEVPIGRIDPAVDAGGAVGEPAPLSRDESVEPVEPEAAPDTEIAMETPAPAPAPDATDEPADAGTPPPAPETAAPPATGGLLLNERHRIPGSGTKADPYVVDFDTLVAVEQSYSPRDEGKTEVPAWIKQLDGKHVSITGFIAFPFLAATAEECMVMLNQWDGCCIGVPPTPYDAVEVQLADSLDLQKGIPNYGTINGVFRTDPYLVNGWLIGLYIMEDAELVTSGSKNQAGF